MVTQTGRRNGSRAIRRVSLKFGFCGITAHVAFTQTVKCFGLEEQEPGTHRTVTVFITRRGETVFHHGKLGTDLHAHGIGGAGIPDRIPGASLTFTDAAGLVDVHGAAAGNHHGVAFNDVDFVFTNGKTDCAGDPVLFIGV